MNEQLKQTKALPANLLLAGRPCLVVGGGKVALRKIGHLLEADAAITVVCPETSPELGSLIHAGRVTHFARPFEAADVDGFVLAFAATSDRYVNRLVLEACRKKNVLCSCVDGNWSKSDFTTPAIARRGNLTLSVSTGGQSCRQAKMVKNSLAKHLEMIETAELVVVGTDHNHLTIDDREPFHLTGNRSERAGFMMMHLWGVHEFVILNTCNRVEVIAMVSKETAYDGILRHILGFDRLKETQFYIKRGAEAYEHLCMVSSGMLSQTPGETHISAQLKESLAVAKQRGWAGNMMQEWISSLLHVSKHIQTDVVPLLHTVEIEDLALSYLTVNSPDLSERTLLILGAGMVGKGLVQSSMSKVGKIIWCYHKNKPDLSTLQNEWDGRFQQSEKQSKAGSDGWKKVELCTFNSIKDSLGEADIIISATEAPGYVLHSGHAPFFDQEKHIDLIDLGMPRNIDPALKELSSELALVDLDGLKHWHRNTVADMENILNRCRNLITEHMEQYERIIKSFQGGNAK